VERAGDAEQQIREPCDRERHAPVATDAAMVDAAAAGMSEGQIARAINASQQTVRKRLAAARRRAEEAAA
jgi:DNA-directed RNA polymerase specialized sigma24 family protein